MHNLLIPHFLGAVQKYPG